MKQEIVSALIAWYRVGKKDMPWRREPTPYHVWISEIMLQQTRIEAAIPYYERFIRALPDVRALAEVDDDELMKLWQGLGYYSRARNLKAAARRLCDEYGCELPREAARLRKLPGIGPYTAGAIASIAYGEPEPAVDGNVLRVIMRLEACEDDVLSPKTRDRVAEDLRAVYPSGKEAGLFTEGLMELGETVCIPNGEPRCELCPVRESCRAFAEGLCDRIPFRSPPKARRIEKRTVLLLSCEGRHAVQKRPEKGLLAGLWEFPNVEGHLSPEAVSAWLTAEGLEALLIEPCGSARHVFSHVEWHMIGYRVACRGAHARFLWGTSEELQTKYAIPIAFQTYLKGLL